MKKIALTLALICFGLMTIGQPKPRIIVETDIGVEPDDQATFVRFLLYANEFDIEGIIINKSELSEEVLYEYNTLGYFTPDCHEIANRLHKLLWSIT